MHFIRHQTHQPRPRAYTFLLDSSVDTRTMEPELAARSLLGSLGSLLGQGELGLSEWNLTIP